MNIATNHSSLHVPYAGAVKQVIAVLSGEVDFAFLAAADVLPRMSDGSLRVLGVASDHRFSLAPDVPTLDEVGIRKQIFDVWYGLLAPTKTPPDRVSTLQKAISKVMLQTDIVSKFRAMGVEVRTSTGPEMMQRFKTDHELYSDIVKKAQITIR